MKPEAYGAPACRQAVSEDKIAGWIDPLPTARVFEEKNEIKNTSYIFILLFI